MYGAPPSDLLDCLKRLRSLMENCWGQHAMHDSVLGTFCIYGGMSRIALEEGPMHLEQEMEAALLDQLHEIAPHFEDRLMGYNDAPHRTKEQILALIDKAIVKQELELLLSNPDQEKNKEEEKELIPA